MKKRYYMAYGSNLCTTQIGRRCRDAKLVGTTFLPNYKLEMKSVAGANGNAYATITRTKDSQVPVAIFDISVSDEKSLDIYEGVSGGHYFKEEMEVEVNNEVLTVMVYIMNPIAKKALPIASYIETIGAGYEEHQFPFEYLEQSLI